MGLPRGGGSVLLGLPRGGGSLTIGLALALDVEALPGGIGLGLRFRGLGGDLVGNVDRILRDEINPDALRVDQADDLFDLFKEGLVPGGRGAGHGEAGQVALHGGDEGRDSDGRQAVDDALQGDGLAGAGCARDQSAAVGALEFERLGIGPAGACAN